MKKLKYLVTGTGRSGTVYMSRLLTNMGIMCGHESIFTPLGFEEAKNRIKNPQLIRTSKVSMMDKGFLFDSNIQIAESSYMAAPYINQEILKNTKIIHVMRNPIKSISSTYYDANFFAANNQGGKKYANFVESHLPELKNINNRLEKNIKYYLLWNEMIQEKCKNANFILHKIELGITKELLDFLGVENNKNIFLSNKINCWNKRKRDICFDEIQDFEIKKRLAQFMKKFSYHNILY
jgi:hypothetical protein